MTQTQRPKRSASSRTAAPSVDPLAVRLPRPYIPHQPHLRQHVFLTLDCFEAFYGGAAAGGKSDALLMAALQYVDVPGYAAILFRRTFADLRLPSALMARSHEWLTGTDARWNGAEHTWTFPSGAKLAFGYLDTERDKYRYQSAEFQFIGFDELTHFQEDDYLYLSSRLRKPADGPLSMVPLRLRAASNPGGIGHRWVRRRYVEKLPRPDDPLDTSEACAKRVFIPARLMDNPSINRDEYTRTLSILDPQTRKQLMDGDWMARPPGEWVFPQGLDEAFQIGAEYSSELAAGKLRPPVDSQLVLCADWGVNSHILVLWPLEAGGFFVPYEVVYHGDSVWDAAKPVATLLQSLGYQATVEPFDASMPGLNAAFLRELRPLLGYKIKHLAVPFNKFKAVGYDYLRFLVANAHDGKLPHLAVSEQGAPVLAEQLRGLQYADPDAGRIDKGDDHGPDALCAGVAPTAAKRHGKG